MNISFMMFWAVMEASLKVFSQGGPAYVDYSMLVYVLTTQQETCVWRVGDMSCA